VRHESLNSPSRRWRGGGGHLLGGGEEVREGAEDRLAKLLACVTLQGFWPLYMYIYIYIADSTPESWNGSSKVNSPEGIRRNCLVERRNWRSRRELPPPAVWRG